MLYGLFPTVVNAVAILLGSLIGLSFHGRVSERYRTILFQAIGLVTGMIGIQYAIQTREVPLLAFSMILGGLLGEWLNIEAFLHSLGDTFQRWMGHRESQFTEGFVYASLLFCIGAMAIVGSFQAGVERKGDLLYTKSLLDGHVAIFLAGAMGAGVMLSALTVFVVQGVLTLLFLAIGSGLPANILTEISAAGGLLIMGISINLLEIGTIRLGNLLPSMFFAGLLVWGKYFIF